MILLQNLFAIRASFIYLGITDIDFSSARKELPSSAVIADDIDISTIYSFSRTDAASYFTSIAKRWTASALQNTLITMIDGHSFA